MFYCIVTRKRLLKIALDTELELGLAVIGDINWMGTTAAPMDVFARWGRKCIF